MLARCPIARLFDGLMDRLENGMENWSVDVHNRTIVCNFEESGGIWWSLTWQMSLDGSHVIFYFHHNVKCIIGLI